MNRTRGNRKEQKENACNPQVIGAPETCPWEKGKLGRRKKVGGTNRLRERRRCPFIMEWQLHETDKGVH